MDEARDTRAMEEMTVVATAAGDYESIRLTMEALSRQTVADRLHVRLVAQSAEVLGSVPDAVTTGFASFEPVYVGPIDDVDKAMASAIRGAETELVAMVEDHAFPEPGWAAGLIEAHGKGDWAAVGSTVVNANPASGCSWANQLMAYGPWTEPVTAGATTHVSRHNISFKMSALAKYLPELEERLGRAGGLLQKLLKDGQGFYVEPAARVRHVNPSRLGSTTQLRWWGGRLSAAARVRREKWGAGKRLVYVAGSPLIPAVRFSKMAGKLVAAGRWKVLPKRLPTVLWALVMDASGQAVGFAVGAGPAERVLAGFEFDRMRHLTDADRATIETG